ncbi:MAG: DMT family transporter [Elusimicrobia bacterium]|nr:MAG: DMT family transporter [Elusimicrobiota bacterium]
MKSDLRHGQTRGHLCGLLAAALFGLSPPLCKRLLGEVSPLVLSGCLYLSGGIALSLYLSGRRILRSTEQESPLRWQDAPLLLGITLFGGVLGPLLMLMGLARLSGLVGSLLLNLEAPMTMALAVLVFREHLSRTEWGAAALIVAGAGTLRLESGPGASSGLGILCIAAACLCWAIDNNLTQRLSLRDPVRVARWKTLGAGSTSLILGLLLDGSMPRRELGAALFVMGALSYGLSLVLDNYALRLIGAAREAALFSTAPFLGGVASLLVLREHPTGWHALGAGLMLTGVIVSLRARHSHRHRHERLEHEHAHVHDEHHQHVHGPSDPPLDPFGAPHSHPHSHTAIEHEHPHASDLHHRHKH